MNNDFNYADDSKRESDSKAGTISPGVNEERSKTNHESKNNSNTDGSIDGITPNDIKTINSLSLEDKQASLIALKALQEGSSAEWSGILPDPQSFNLYPENVQERMLNQADAFTVDESKRQDKLVKAEIETSKRNTWISAALFVLCLLSGLTAFLITNNQWSWTPLALPAISFLKDLIAPIKSHSSNNSVKTK
ncbi:hypothetical protein ACMZ79_01005 [Gardnerella vaginalis]|uniref:hypothetical protein n=1 Tax=Gardnerella vaginalis TaxID=2702 RepID=UPI0039EEBE73